ncbi:hypothetical protein EMPG_15284 [Blastomyces silverae]|uniref:Uncharacterized protein n=1 Tax=Blastomyces silverae TaxID=2060906 RepID=A0A0H1BCZ5_9EURO|nr:hypothetical protein EMPG_15284 [Blastomyces silverae]
MPQKDPLDRNTALFQTHKSLALPCYILRLPIERRQLINNEQLCEILQILHLSKVMCLNCQIFRGRN